VDGIGYAFGWVLVALPVFFVLGTWSTSAFLVFAATSLIIDLHRHYTLPYVYLDSHVRRSYPVRFLLLPAVCLALWSQTPDISRSPGVLGTPAVGAMLLWGVFVVQLVRQDRGGPFQYRVAIPIFLGAVGAASLATIVLGTVVGSAWVWLGAAVVGSVALHVTVSRDVPGDPLAGRRTHWLFPVAALFVALATSALPRAALQLPSRAPASLLILTFTVWQTYHVLMQKYGIFRIYSAKSGQAAKVPGWVDRSFVLSVVPAYLIWAGSSQLGELEANLLRSGEDVARVLVPPLSFLGRHLPIFLGIAGAFAGFCIGAFLYHEWRVHRLRNAPRLVFAAGTLGLYAVLFPLGLLGSYVVFACSHAVEYIVFIWAFQRRRYGTAELRAQVLSKLLRRPLAFYLGFTALVVGGIVFARYGAQIPVLSSLSGDVFGYSPLEWLGWYTLYQGVLHFYYDGFLWKLRKPSLRAQM